MALSDDSTDNVRHIHANRLAIDGGTPVRTDPLPWELPGAHYIGEEELELVSRVVRARSPFRFYGPDPQHMVDTLETASALRISIEPEMAGTGNLWAEIESGKIEVADLGTEAMPRLPKTIDFTVDYLRSGLPRDAYARARVNRSGRRYASVHVEAWQDNRSRLFAQATGHFLMPPPAGDD